MKTLCGRHEMKTQTDVAASKDRIGLRLFLCSGASAETGVELGRGSISEPTESHRKPCSIRHSCYLLLLTLRQCIAFWLHCQCENRRVAQSCPLWFDGLALYFFINDDMRWNIFDISLAACFHTLKFIEE